jgi:serine/threonine protein kinase
MSVIKAAQRAQLDRDDIGRILQCLLKDTGCAPGDTFDKYVEVRDRRMTLRPNVPRKTILPSEYSRGLMAFDMAGGYQIIPGGSAIVLEVGNQVIPSLHYALKVERPSARLQDYARRSTEGEEHAEFLKHGPLSHQNVARVYAAGQLLRVPNSLRPGHIDVDAIIMEWIVDAVPLNGYISGVTYSGEHLIRNPHEVVSLITQSFDAIAYLHSAQLIHWDLKSDNLLVNRDGVVKLMDIGNARRIGDYPANKTAISTIGNLPPDLFNVAREQQRRSKGRVAIDSRRAVIQLSDGAWDCKWLDLWMLARELYELFAASPHESYAGRILGREGVWTPRRAQFLRETFGLGARNPGGLPNQEPPLALSFIRLLLERLLNPEDPWSDCYYEEAADAADDLHKLAPEFGAAQNIAELWAFPQHVVRMPISGSVPWSRRIASLLDLYPVQRLRRHLQLGSVAKVYPAATHTRFEHTVGVLQTTGDFVRALYSDRANPFWRAAIEELDVKALIIASVAHDIGHIAYGQLSRRARWPF